MKTKIYNGTEWLPTAAGTKVRLPNKWLGVNYTSKVYDGEEWVDFNASNSSRLLYKFGALSDVHIQNDTGFDDFAHVIPWLDEAGVDFNCNCGDMISGQPKYGTPESQLLAYKNALESLTDTPTYAISGNHEGKYFADVENIIRDYTGHPIFYSFEVGDDVFVMLGIKSNTENQLFSVGALQWLADTLEYYRNKRVFLFEHVRPDDACGNVLNIYNFDIWDNRAGHEGAVFESIINHYTNVLFFHGHSHLRYELQDQVPYEYANIEPAGLHFNNLWGVHISSVTVPRGTDSIVNPERKEYYGESQGYLVDVYSDKVVLHAMDFVRDNELYTYNLPTELAVIPAGAFSNAAIYPYNGHIAFSTETEFAPSTMTIGKAVSSDGTLADDASSAVSAQITPLSRYIRGENNSGMDSTVNICEYDSSDALVQKQTLWTAGGSSTWKQIKPIKLSDSTAYVRLEATITGTMHASSLVQFSIFN